MEQVRRAVRKEAFYFSVVIEIRRAGCGLGRHEDDQSRAPERRSKVGGMPIRGDEDKKVSGGAGPG